MKKLGIGLLLLIGTLAAIYFLKPDWVLQAGQYMERSAANLEQHEIQVGEHKIVYLKSTPENASDKLPIVLLHGFGADKDNWTRLAKYFDDQVVWVPDLPGHGESSRLDSADYRASLQVERLHQWAQAMGIKRFHLAGNSMGGMISAVYADKYPEQVASVTLINNGGIYGSKVESDFQKQVKAGKNPLVVTSKEDYDRLLKYVFVEPPFMPDPIKGYFADLAVKHRAFNTKIFSDLLAERLVINDHIQRSKVPLLVIWGDSDNIFDVATVDVIKALRPEATYKVLKKCGHAPMIERPEETAGYMREFQAKL